MYGKRPFFATPLTMRMTVKNTQETFGRMGVIDTPLKTALYKDTVSDLNQEYRALLNSYLIGDCRVVYLRKFELILSQNCPGSMLWSMPTYIRATRHAPLPDEPSSYVSRKKFFFFLQIYEAIMREIGLVGQAAEPEKEMKIFDMGGE